MDTQNDNEEIRTNRITMRARAKVVAIHEKSNGRVFKNVQPDDILEFSVPIKAAGQASKGTKATYITVTNTRNDEAYKYSFNQLAPQLSKLNLLVL